METTFQSPNNPLAAMWASAVESYVRKKNPGMPLQQVRRLPMMQGLYGHLSQLKKKKSVPNPATQPALSGDALTIAQDAWLSQEYFNLAVSASAFAAIGEGSSEGNSWYLKFISLINTYNYNNNIADFSTGDVGGFALCVIIWLAMVGVSESSYIDSEILQYLKKQLPLNQAEVDEIQEFIDDLANVNFTIQYRDASNYPDYKAIPWQIPTGSQIVMLGDWGTSLDDAHDFLYALWQKAYLNNPGGEIVFIHLGDIYYCGLPYECQNYFYDVFETVGTRLQELYGATFNMWPPIFTLPGNHEYYSLGYGYFGLLDNLNTQVATIDHSKLQQQCSFFCLRTADNKWQFLGMDTGQADGNGLLSALQAAEGWVLDKINNMVGDVPDWLAWSEEMVSKVYEDVVGPFQPELQPNELKWHQDRINEFEGKTILLSHHQLFSREAKINHSSPEFMNTWLDKHFKNYYKNDIAAWYWGHEHTFAAYLNGLNGLNKGRLLGSSSYEATDDDDTPYADNYPAVLFESGIMDPLPIKTYNGLLYHAGALLAQSAQNAEEMVVDYYQFAAWSQLQSPPAALQLDFIKGENITYNFKSLKPSWAGNLPISQGNVTTDQAPSLAAWNDMLYMLYPDGTGNSEVLTLCTANAASLASDYSNSDELWSSPSAIFVDGNSVITGISPAIVAVDDMLYGFYVDTANNSDIIGISCLTTGDTTQWTSFDGVTDDAIAISACFFQGCIYIVYLKSSNNLHWAYFDVATGSLTGLGKLIDADGDNLQSATVPALCADASRIYLLYTKEGGTDVHWATGTPSAEVPQENTSSMSWVDQGKVETTSDGGQSNPDTNAGMTMCYGSGVFFMVYASTNTDLTLCALDGADENNTGNWVGKNTIQPMDSKGGGHSTAQSSQCPAMVVTAGGGFLVYRGATHDEIYWAYY